MIEASNLVKPVTCSYHVAGIGKLSVPKGEKDHMMHARRAHSRKEISTPEELARLLTEHSWCVCVGFEHAGYLYLNDATSGDGAFEVAVFKATPNKHGDHEQIESITFGWCDYEKALEYIREISAGRYDRVLASLPLRAHPEGSCVYCA